MILRICGSKPMSSMRSAVSNIENIVNISFHIYSHLHAHVPGLPSSSTKYVHRAKLVIPRSRKSIKRPGVAITTSTPRSKSRAYTIDCQCVNFNCTVFFLLLKKSIGMENEDRNIPVVLSVNHRKCMCYEPMD